MKVFFLLPLLPFALGAPAPFFEKPRAAAAAPVVVIPAPQATVTGKSDGSIESFTGIPFAQPPVGSLRLKPPQPLTSVEGGQIDATKTPKACPQFLVNANLGNIPAGVLGAILDNPFFQVATDAGEDCLTVNVQRPAGMNGTQLPVLFWIFGGGFELGSTQMYDGSSLIAEGVKQGKPFVFVAVNHRIGGFGFLPGKEIKADGSANLGLLDQRLGLQWTADNIAAFGGDPSKVTIWGESSGSISVLDQMILYDGDYTYKGQPLFRGAIMESGSIIPAEPVDGTKGQAVFDQVASKAGCGNASDKLDCLRKADYTTYLNAANSVPGIFSYNALALAYLPRPDGKVLTDSPDTLVESNRYAKVPFICGDQEDEGTLFALFTSNLTTTADISTYIKTLYFPQAPVATIDALIATYNDSNADGSPFRTSSAENWYPQYKRMAAIFGDLTFTLVRRAFLEITSLLNPAVPSWSYIATYDYGTPILGTFHASDLLQVFFGVKDNNAATSIRGYYYSFLYHLDPNVDNDFGEWPQWNESNMLRSFQADANTLLADDFRGDSFNVIVDNRDVFKI